MSQYKYIKFCLTMKMKVAQIRSNQISHSVVSDSLRPHESQHGQASLSITNSLSSLRLTSIESVIPSSHLILSCPRLLLPSVKVFSNDFSELISFRIYWFGLLAIQRTLKRLLQHHNSKASILLHSAFFMV